MKIMKVLLEPFIELPKMFTDLKRIEDNAENIAKVKGNGSCKESDDDGQDTIGQAERTVRA